MNNIKVNNEQFNELIETLKLNSINNDTIKGYIILALENTNNNKIIKYVLNELDFLFDTVTTEEAKKYYLKGGF